MKQIKVRVFQAACVAVMLFAAGHSHANLAQNPTPPAAEPTPEFLSITVISVKPEMVSEFQTFMKDTTNPALKKGGVKWRDTWQNTPASGDAFESSPSTMALVHSKKDWVVRKRSVPGKRKQALW